MKRCAIIVAGGHGKRMNTSVPKQFLHLSGKPLLFFSIYSFYNSFPDIKIIVVLPVDYITSWKRLCKKHRLNISHEIVEGGKHRFESVKNGLSLAGEAALTAIHDGVRPNCPESLIKRAFHRAAEEGNAVPAIPVNSSVRIKSHSSYSPVDRERVRLIQTPQVFLTRQLLDAYQQPYQDRFTDDATVVESLGIPIHLIEGEPLNIKVTNPQDLVILEALMNKK